MEWMKKYLIDQPVRSESERTLNENMLPEMVKDKEIEEKKKVDLIERNNYQIFRTRKYACQFLKVVSKWYLRSLHI